MKSALALLVAATLVVCGVMGAGPLDDCPPKEICTTRYDPVCVTYELSYGNECGARSNECELMKKGLREVRRRDGRCN